LSFLRSGATSLIKYDRIIKFEFQFTPPLLSEIIEQPISPVSMMSLDLKYLSQFYVMIIF